MITPAPVAYHAHSGFIAPAGKARELWRLVLGSIIILAIYIVPIIAFGRYLHATYGWLIAEAILQRMSSGDTPGSVLMLLWSFLGLALGPMIVVRLLHKRLAGTLFGPSARQAVRDFFTVLWPLLALQIGFLAFSIRDEAIQPGVAFGTFLAYLPIALPSLLIQTGAEEIVFRGYLQQQLAARFNHALIWMGLPSLLFALGHYAPGDFGESAWTMVLWAAAFGAFAADLTARTGSLGAAIGFHFANNVAALLFIGIAHQLDGLSLWSRTLDLSDPAALLPALVLDFAGMFVAWLLARLALRV